MGRCPDRGLGRIIKRAVRQLNRLDQICQLRFRGLATPRRPGDCHFNAANGLKRPRHPFQSSQVPHASMAASSERYSNPPLTMSPGRWACGGLCVQNRFIAVLLLYTPSPSRHVADDKDTHCTLCEHNATQRIRPSYRPTTAERTVSYTNYGSNVI